MSFKYFYFYTLRKGGVHAFSFFLLSIRLQNSHLSLASGIWEDKSLAAFLIWRLFINTVEIGLNIIDIEFGSEIISKMYFLLVDFLRLNGNVNEI